MVFKFMLAQTAFALQIEAPEEIAEHISAYAKEIGMEKNNAILRASIAKNAHCNTYKLQLIDQNIKKTEFCSADLPNAALQNAVFELFGHKNLNKPANPNIRTILIGASFIATGILLYYSNPPRPVYGGKK
jgi:uncharacterized protein YjbI with pentapeptide repeats